MSLIMRKIKDIEEVLNGKRTFSDESKYLFLCHSIAIVHIVITFRFLMLNYTILYLYNFVSVIFYLVIGTIFSKKKKFYTIYLCSYIEILLHSSLASLLAGWDWGFMLYILALMPVAFYLAYSLPQFGRNLAKPFTFTFIAMCIFLATRIASAYISPIYTQKTYDSHLTFAYSFNALVALLMLIFFSLLFAIEIRRNEIRLESQNQILSTISSKDPLTGLLNRRSMDVHLSEAISLTQNGTHNFSVIIGDIDDFKKVNDTYGHNIGDDVLINIANTITSQLPESAKVCRWGGEEILILVHEDSIQTALIAENIRSAISRCETKTPNTVIRITMTFGVAQYQDGIPIQKLVSLADENLYKGKKNGKNQVVA